MSSALKNILIIVSAAVVLYLILKYLNSKNVRFVPKIPIQESFEANDLGGMDNRLTPAPVSQASMDNPTSDPGRVAKSLTATDLLPTDKAADDWNKNNPSVSASLQDVNLLQAGHHIGVNTVGQTLRNANLQLRSDPPNPQTKVSPWLQSTISPDVVRKQFEIGCQC